ncbi:Branched-chain acyl-CoA dehydrogenase [Pseudonocardia sp. Ae168_Ps1]|uniref:acyl-CoA dehydrogenase family protein n=1 Tax=unclassified Pseudonocardia TaxID=2619320 RepID=UPI00094AEF1C|nr:MULTISPECIES: acyl-CoA dehydrogenase family protein [unclassified Pseudonocardia]OLL74461.1 Branched-chain acyl-CoA dehydrogenase [Pseudonocardia sp. Ae150A_Ps1]OLL80441.1 Branched-chain acyl-CoA dehydrogenase [Pseudonocardia sp. Ae168_Ps1]OLL85432.1 Branched-chain acyl-CoA dehydrogenase [Pseudonocardia sp. Ae263_Ps1]OLL94541.1 Branched-chain acyl-CoA dehydrogenase [Pseudonocardia sp. Ae356_Ps1]
MTTADTSDLAELDEIQQALVDTAQEFATERIAPHAVDWDRDKHFPVDVLREAAKLGMAALYVADEHGGTGLSRLDAVLVFEALATGCPSLAGYLSIHNMVAGMIDRHGTDEQRERLLPALCSMDELGSYCLTEPDAGSDAAALRTTAVRDGEGWVLDGVKQFISGAGTSDRYLVFARTGAAGAGGITAFVVPKGAAGLEFGPNEDKMGWNAQPTRQVILRDVRVPDTDRLGETGGGFRIAMGGLDGGRLNIAACSLGGARAALDKAVAHLTDRQAFGGPLARQQGLRFRIADAYTELAAARLLLHRAARAADAGEPAATRLCAMAKRLATDTGHEVADTALQLHGGYGYLAEYGIEKIVRDLRVHRILEGTNEVMRVIVSRGLMGAER